MRRNNTALAWMLLLLALVLVVLGGLMTGPSDFSLGRMMDGLLGRNASAAAIIYELRLPRVLMGLISGGILSLADYLNIIHIRQNAVQTTTDNRVIIYK